MNQNIIHIYDKNNYSELITDSNWIDYREYTGNASILVKENIESDKFLRLVLKYHNSKKTRLSHCFIMKEKTETDNSKFFLLTDCAINTEPTLKERATIAENAIKFRQTLSDTAKPYIVNFLTPNGHLSLSVKESMNSLILKEYLSNNYDANNWIFDMKQLDYCLYPESRSIKKGTNNYWSNKITDLNRNADILIVNNLCEGNSLCKALFPTYIACGYVLGADIPVIMNSRSNLFNNHESIDILTKKQYIF